MKALRDSFGNEFEDTAVARLEIAKLEEFAARQATASTSNALPRQSLAAGSSLMSSAAKKVLGGSAGEIPVAVRKAKKKGPLDSSESDGAVSEAESTSSAASDAPVAKRHDVKPEVKRSPSMQDRKPVLVAGGSSQSSSSHRLFQPKLRKISPENNAADLIILSSDDEEDVKPAKLTKRLKAQVTVIDDSSDEDVPPVSSNARKIPSNFKKGIQCSN